MGERYCPLPTPCRRRYEHRHCSVCKEAYGTQIDPDPLICGRPGCRAHTDWGPEEWAGRARMARARRDAGVALDDLDRESLERNERGAAA